jgi:hypothetical protein
MRHPEIALIERIAAQHQRQDVIDRRRPPRTDRSAEIQRPATNRAMRRATKRNFSRALPLSAASDDVLSHREPRSAVPRSGDRSFFASGREMATPRSPLPSVRTLLPPGTPWLCVVSVRVMPTIRSMRGWHGRLPSRVARGESRRRTRRRCALPRPLLPDDRACAAAVRGRRVARPVRRA